MNRRDFASVLSGALVPVCCNHAPRSNPASFAGSLLENLPCGQLTRIVGVGSDGMFLVSANVVVRFSLPRLPIQGLPLVVGAELQAILPGFRQLCGQAAKDLEKAERIHFNRIEAKQR